METLRAVFVPLKGQNPRHRGEGAARGREPPGQRPCASPEPPSGGGGDGRGAGENPTGTGRKRQRHSPGETPAGGNTAPGQPPSRAGATRPPAGAFFSAPAGGRAATGAQATPTQERQRELHHGTQNRRGNQPHWGGKNRPRRSTPAGRK